ncbi:MAG: hypothetical protein H7223_04750, partial [Pedobacter sp.]|nr:hypothetical protein [Pedobacter sp.]
MKASIRLHLYTHKTYTDGAHPVILQYIIDGKVTKRVLTRCKLKEWDAKNLRLRGRVKDAARLNNMIASEFAKAEQAIFDLKAGKVTVSEALGNRGNVITLGDAFGLELVRLEKEFKSGYYDKIAAIRKQIPDLTIPIEDIDNKWFDRFIRRMGGDAVGNSNNTIKKKIKLLRGEILRYSSKGVTREVKAVTIATTRTVKQKLSGEELALLEKLYLQDSDLLSATRD